MASKLAKVSSTWWSPRLKKEVLTCRWGHAGVPVLLFPTAGGDAEECERFHMMKVLDELISGGRIRVYSSDSVAGRVWTDGESSGAHRAWMQGQYDAFMANEVIPAIRKDCGDPAATAITAGASIGAFNAIAAVCRHPDLFHAGVGMSGTYDLTRWMDGEHTMDFHFASPMHFVPQLPEGSAQLEGLRKRLLILATGEGDYEAPWESWQIGQVLGARRIPNRVDFWGESYRHDWNTWRDMLPKYLDELTK